MSDGLTRPAGKPLAVIAIDAIPGLPEAGETVGVRVKFVWAKRFAAAKVAKSETSFKRELPLW